MDLISQSRTQPPLLDARTVLQASAAVLALTKGEAGTNSNLSIGLSCAELTVAMGLPAPMSTACNAQSEADISAMWENSPFCVASELHRTSRSN